LRVIAGEAFGRRSPVQLLWPTLYVDGLLSEGARLEIGADYTEQALYVAEGEIEVSGVRGSEGELLILSSGDAVTLSARRTSRVILLGGERFATPRFIWWNFVGSSLERIEKAKRDWAENRFAQVPGENDFIPLPPD
jgi:hypothetical protein